MEWNVRMETTAPEVIEEDQLAIYGAGFDDLLAKLEPFGASGGLGPKGWDLVVTVEAGDPYGAMEEGTTTIISAMSAVGLPMWKINELRVVEAELDWAHNEEPTFPDVVGVAEVLQMLEISSSRLSQLRQAGRFPEPMLELKATPLCARSGIEGFMQWRRDEGRPRAPRRFLVQHLDMGEGKNEPIWTRWADTLEEALAAADAVYNPTDPNVRQEIIETIDDDTTEWRFRVEFQTEWSPPRRGVGWSLTQPTLARVMPGERSSNRWYIPPRPTQATFKANGWWAEEKRKVGCTPKSGASWTPSPALCGYNLRA